MKCSTEKTVALITMVLLTIWTPIVAKGELLPRAPRDFSDGGASFGTEPTPAGWEPATPFDAEIQVGDEQRMLLHGVEVGSTGLDAGRLTGIIYDLRVVHVQRNAGEVEIWYGTAGRNPLPGTSGGEGGRFEIYDDKTTGNAEDTERDYFSGPDLDDPPDVDVDVNPLRPFDWFEGGGPHNGNDRFPGVNTNDVGEEDFGSRLWLQGKFDQQGTVDTDGDAVPDTAFVKKETLDLSTGTHTDITDLTVIPTAGFALDQNYINTTGTISIATSLIFPPNNGYEGTSVDDGNWAMSSTDSWSIPIAQGVNSVEIGNQDISVTSDADNTFEFNGATSFYTPEPGTALLFALGLLGLLLVGRRKRAK